MFRRSLIALILCLMPAVAFGQVSDNGKPVKVITDADIVGTVNFDSDTVYNLDGFVFVDSGEVLNIEAGTIIKSNPGQAELATALIVSQGGKIFANGTRECPIIFTSTDDDVDDPDDIPAGSGGRALWGGVIMLGYSTLNTTTGVGNIEGLPASARTQYGRPPATAIENDNSGTLQYVSIRHGGSVFGDANEINGLTLGGVGNGTVIDHLEVFQNFDDGIEWFGGTVRMKHVIVAFCGDDSYDIDEGWSGGVQYAFTIMDTDDSDQGGEHDGGTTPENGTPYATPVFSNVTYLGAGYQSPTSVNPSCFNIRDNCSPAYYNSIFSDHNGFAVAIEQTGSQPTDSEDRWLAGDMVFRNNAWGLFKSGNTAAALAAAGQTWTRQIWTNGSFQNRISDPGINVTRVNDQRNDPRPKNTGAKNLPEWTTPTAYNPPVKPNFGQNFAGFFDQVDYVGAFDPTAAINELWVANWTAFDFYGYLGENDGGCGGITDDGKPVKVITDANIVGNVFFSSDTVYNLDGFVFVDSGEVLNIEAGTIIKSNPGQAELATALIVSQGGKIFANGTRECPIIFTSTDDDVDDPDDIPAGSGGRALWGGVIMLGYSTLNTTTGVGNIEGLPASARTQYGRPPATAIENDNSGTLQYVSIRHGGSVFGDANEINGLTLGGVGNGTVIDHLEVFQNFDDGIEWFGGTVRMKHVIVAFCGDDSYDIDEGWSGGVQYAFTIMDTDDSDQGGEHDGGTTPENGTPYATPVFSNVTYLGAGYQSPTSVNPSCFNIRDNCSPAYYNSIFSDHNGFAVAIEQTGSQPTDSEDRWLAGDMVFRNNAWGLFKSGNTAAALAAAGQTWTQQIWTNGSFSNAIADPQIYVSRLNDQQNDPRPKATSGLPSWTTPTAYNPPVKPNFGQTFAGFFDQVDYVGAFDPAQPIEDNWMAGWSAFDTYGYLGENNGSSSCCVGNTGNVNDDAGDLVDLSDLIYLVNFLFLGGPAPACSAAANINGDAGCSVDLSDLIALVNFLFLGGAAPAACVPGC